MRSVYALLIALILVVSVVGAQQTIELSGGTVLNVREINGSFGDPHSMAFDVNGYLWATDRITGNIWRMHPAGFSTLAGSIDISFDKENPAIRGGLFGIAIDPNFANGAPYVYISYTLFDNKLVIARCEFDGKTLGAPQPLMTVPNVPRLNGHSMMMMADGTLLVSVGSFDNSDPASPNKINGKVIRMNLDGSAPSNNPLFMPDYPTAPESYIWVYGQRQTAGFTQLPGNHGSLPGAIYSVEPGPNSYDEINRVLPGENYGWNLTSGYCRGSVNNIRCPEATFNYTPSSVAFYGSNAVPEWTNTLLVGTMGYSGLMVAGLNAQGGIDNIDPNLPKDNVMVVDEDHLIVFLNDAELERIRDVKVVEDGRIYLALVTIGESRHGRVVALENPAVHTPLSSVGETETGANFTYGPNPMTDFVNVSLDKPFASNWTLRLTDMMGRTLSAQQFNADATKVSMPTSNLANGAYMLVLSDGRETRSAAVVK